MGLVSQVFTENDLATLTGNLAVGHCRYSTTGLLTSIGTMHSQLCVRQITAHSHSLTMAT
jgi:glutamine phosphoribosylpyrophosphate amidotransferase